MRKGQIKLLEKAEKEGFTEEQLAVLRGNQMLYTLDYYYFLLKRGVSASVINAIIKAGEGWGMHSFGFQLMECGYSLEDILTYIEKSKKLLHFVLDDGTGTDRIILSGIHAYYEPEELVGKTLLAITNLPPRSMMGIDSCGMLLSAVHTVNGEEKLNLVMLDDAIPAGAKLY